MREGRGVRGGEMQQASVSESRLRGAETLNHCTLAAE
jgi:hypothetical protein